MKRKRFISVKKAAAWTGKSERKILKICEANRATPFVRHEDGLYKIRVDFLLSQLGLVLRPEPVAEAAPVGNGAEPNRVMNLLEGQLAEKDRQIAIRDAQLAQLIERSREQNNIIYALERSKQALEARLSLPAPVPEKIPLPEKKQPDYGVLALVILLVGVLLIIFYALLLN